MISILFCVPRESGLHTFQSDSILPDGVDSSIGYNSFSSLENRGHVNFLPLDGNLETGMLA